VKRLLAKLEIADRASFILFTKQFLKFGIVGVSNTLIALSTYYLLLYLGLHYMLANIVAFIISVCNAYFWNSRFVFISKRNSHAKPFLKVVLAYGSTVLLGTGILFCLVELLHISEWIAPLFGLCITIPTNFLLNKYWAFRK
jgi:putative flippase GtrA